MITIDILDLDSMEEFGLRLGSLLESGDIVCLDGDLGAGKTTLTQSIGRGLEVVDYITSPSFAIINEYAGRLPVYHFDVYRLESPEEGFDLGFDEYFYGEGVTIIEWSEKIREILPEAYLHLYISVVDESSRKIELKAKGKRYEELLEELK